MEINYDELLDVWHEKVMTKAREAEKGLLNLNLEAISFLDIRAIVMVC